MLSIPELYQRPLAVEKVRTQEPVNDAEAEEFSRWLVNRTALQLRRMTKDPEVLADIPENRLSEWEGLCGHAQSVMSCGLTELGIPHHLIRMQDIIPNLPCELWHGNLIIPIKGRIRTGHFLYDPTFRQFCVKSAENAPGRVMAGIDGGATIRSQLLKKGWIKLTPETAKIYLASFNTSGKNFKREEAPRLLTVLAPLEPVIQILRRRHAIRLLTAEGRPCPLNPSSEYVNKKGWRLEPTS